MAGPPQPHVGSPCAAHPEPSPARATRLSGSMHWPASSMKTCVKWLIGNWAEANLGGAGPGQAQVSPGHWTTKPERSPQLALHPTPQPATSLLICTHDLHTCVCAHSHYLLAVMRVVIMTRYSCSFFLEGNTYSPLLASQLQQGCGCEGGG